MRKKIFAESIVKFVHVNPSFITHVDTAVLSNSTGINSGESAENTPGDPILRRFRHSLLRSVRNRFIVASLRSLLFIQIVEITEV